MTRKPVLKDLDLGVVRAVGLTPANVPEATVTSALEDDLNFQQVTLKELHQCTTSQRGRSVSIHPDESLLQELRQHQLTADGFFEFPLPLLAG